MALRRRAGRLRAAERRAQQLIAITFWLLAAYVTVDATITLASGDHPASSPVGIALSIVTLIGMPLLATAKASVAQRLNSSAGHSESRQNLLCAYLSAGLLVGLTLNAAFGWWWADPITALVIAAVAAAKDARAGAVRAAAPPTAATDPGGATWRRARANARRSSPPAVASRVGALLRN